jgi:acetyl esterase/lipase
MKVTLDMIDPELREMAEAFMDSSIDNDEAFCQGMEAGTQMVDFKKPEDMQYSEVWIPRKKDGSKLRLVILKPLSQKEKLPGVFWIHGGAFASGAPEGSMSVFRRLMEAGNCVIVSPDYRLSLEAPYPAGLEDCYEALLWTKTNAKELGIRENQIAVGGDSTGASFTVSLVMMARDRGEVSVAFQMPLFPCLDDRMTSESMKDNNSPLVDRNLIYFAWKYYLGDLFETDNVPVYAAPARAKDFSRLPPFISYVGGIDPLKDDDVIYAENLKKAGVPIHFQVFEGCFHGFEEFCPDAEISKRAKKFFIDSYKYAVENYFAEQPSLPKTLRE